MQHQWNISCPFPCSVCLYIPNMLYLPRYVKRYLYLKTPNFISFIWRQIPALDQMDSGWFPQLHFPHRKERSEAETYSHMD